VAQTAARLRKLAETHYNSALSSDPFNVLAVLALVQIQLRQCEAKSLFWDADEVR
jgi:hypothetical protein